MLIHHSAHDLLELLSAELKNLWVVLNVLFCFWQKYVGSRSWKLPIRKSVVIGLTKSSISGCVLYQREKLWFIKSWVGNQKVFIHLHFVILNPQNISPTVYCLIVSSILSSCQYFTTSNVIRKRISIFNFVQTVKPHLALYVLGSFDFEV